MRDEPRHHLNSKLTCWVALDRAIGLEDLLRPEASHVERWQRERTAIAEAILEEGYDHEVGAFTQAFSHVGLVTAAAAIAACERRGAAANELVSGST